MEYNSLNKLFKVHQNCILNVNYYLIEFSNSIIMIDCGYPRYFKRIENKLKSIGKPLQKLILTHSHIDHFGNAFEIKEKYNCEVFIHEDDKNDLLNGLTQMGEIKGLVSMMKVLLPFYEKVVKIKGIKADFSINKNCSIFHEGVNISIVHLPGHTQGSVGIKIENVMFIGDLATNFSGKVKPQKYYAVDWVKLYESIDRVKKEKVEYYFSGHGKGFIRHTEFQKCVID